MKELIDTTLQSLTGLLAAVVSYDLISKGHILPGVILSLIAFTYTAKIIYVGFFEKKEEQDD